MPFVEKKKLIEIQNEQFLILFYLLTFAIILYFYTIMWN